MKRVFLLLTCMAALAAAQPAVASCHAPAEAIVVHSAAAAEYAPAFLLAAPPVVIVESHVAPRASQVVVFPTPDLAARGARVVSVPRRGLSRRLRVIVRP